jgi:hypothetical protein
VYKKFLNKNGKLYGPYLYENKRVGQKIITSYIGRAGPENNFSKLGTIFRDNKWVFFLVLLLIFVGFLLVLDIFLQFVPTGWAVLNLQPIYQEGQAVKGFIDLEFNGGELIPKDSKVYISLGSQNKIFNLTDLVNGKITSGNFYAEDSSISGFGEGYGLAGKKITYPEINFKIFVYSNSEANSEIINNTPSENNEEPIIPEENSDVPIPEEPVQNSEEDDNSENQDIAGITTQIPDTTPEISSSDLSEITDSTTSPTESAESVIVSSSESTESVDSAVSSSEGEPSGITAQVISETEYTFDAVVSKDNPFSYSIEEGQNFRIVSDSVKIDNGTISENLINLNRDGNNIKVTTDYSLEETGFGQEFLSEDKLRLPIDISELNLLAENSTLEVKLVYNDNILASSSRKILTISDNSENLDESIAGNISLVLLQDIPLIRFKSGESAFINLSEYFQNAITYGFNAENISANFDNDILFFSADSGFRGARKARILAYRGEEILESNEFTILVSSGKISISTSHDEIKLGKKVRWIANISLENPENVSLQIPIQAENISIAKIQDSNIEEVSAEIKKITPSGEEIIQTSYQKEERDNQNSESLITGNVIVDLKLKKRDSFIISFFKQLIKITGFTVESVQEDATNLETLEVNIAQNENITNYIIEYYTDAPFSIEKNMSYGKQVVISTFGELNYTNILSYSIIPEIYNLGEEDRIKLFWVENNTYLNFDSYDLDGNNKLDYIEWITPHLSNQTFEIILITKAQHLDFNRNFISDIYDYVKTQDANWSEVIGNNEYVRVTFERALDKTKDITIFARNANNESASIEVYTQDGNQSIVRFDNISEEGLYKVYLTNLPENYSSETFDLKILTEGGIEFDWIVDPSIYNASAGNNTIWECGNITSPGTYTLNQSIRSNGTCMYINSDDVILDGNGSVIDYNTDYLPNSFGISIYSNNNITLRNLILINNDTLNSGNNSAILTVASIGSLSIYNNTLLTYKSNYSLYFPGTATNIFLMANNTLVSTSPSASGVYYVGNAFATDTTFTRNNFTGFGADIYATSPYNTNILFIDQPLGGVYLGSSTVPIFQDTSYGKILFLTSIDVNSSNLFGNPTSDIRILNNSVYVNSSQTGLNKSANITFYNIGNRGFTNPVILKNGALCLNCYNFTALNTSTVIFNVSSWSNYSIGEDPRVLTSCVNITLSGVYTLNQSINSDGTCIWILNNNVTLDGRGHNITGPSSGNFMAIRASFVSNVTIKNFGKISGLGFYDAIGFEAVNNSRIENITFNANNRGIEFWSRSRNNTLTDLIMINNTQFGIYFNTDGGNNTVRNVLINTTNSPSQGQAIYLSASTGNFFDNLTLYSNNYGIYFSTSNATILNSNLYNNYLGNIFLTGSNNYPLVIYNNSFGEIKWRSNSLTSNNSLTFPGNISIGNNSAYYNPNGNSSADGLNSSANITLYNLGNRGFVNPTILKDGTIDCRASGACYNFTALNASTVIFNVSSWSNYSIGEIPAVYCPGGMSGYGNRSNPCQITNWTQLNAVRNNLTASYVLLNNLNSSTSGYGGIGDSFVPIGNDSLGYYFLGNFYGNYSNISDLIVTGSNFVGLFGYITGNISDLGLVNASVTGLDNVGILAGYSSGIVNNSFSRGIIRADDYVGGLVGTFDGSVLNSHSFIDINGSTDIGGLVGYSNAIINNSYSYGNVNGTDSDIGGLVGQEVSGTIANSYSFAKVKGGYYVGGLVGLQTGGSIVSSYTLINSSVSGSNTIGALVGDMEAGTINNSYSIIESGAILSGVFDVGFIGHRTSGVVSNNFMKITNSSWGNITFTGLVIGATGNILQNISISNNSVYVNSVNAGLNKSANITLIGVRTDFTNPVILRNGTNICNATTTPSCSNFTSLNAGTVRFNVSSWSNYSIGEGPETIPPNFTNLANQTLSHNAPLEYDIDASDASNISCFIVNDTINFVINCTGYLRNITALTPGLRWINITVNDTLNNKNSQAIYVNSTNAVPNVTLVIINSSLGTNYTNEDLKCYANITDADGDNVYGNYSWFKNGVLNLSGQTSILTGGNLNLISTLSSGNTTKHENWSCSILGYDGFAYANSWINSTNLTIRNSAPVNSTSIPNQAWAKNINQTNAFDLDDYFTDIDSDVLNYTSLLVDNITVSINSTNNNVSFFPDFDFFGTRYLTFFANDSENPSLVASNNVTLYVYFCGNGICDSGYGEDCGNCADCSCSVGQTCQSGVCTSGGGPGCLSTGCPSASSISCGTLFTDNCKNSCGTGTFCSSGTCTNGECVVCTPICQIASTVNCGSPLVSLNGCDQPCLGTGTFCSSGTCTNGECISCNENWSCTGWGPCIAGEQIRICTDQNSCGTFVNKPVEIQNCVVPVCTSDLQCDDNNPCTTDSCNSFTSTCSYSNNQNSCNDNDACTVDDACYNGFCSGSQKSCDLGYTCSNGDCVEGEKPKTIPPELLRGSRCIPDYICGTWGVCEAEYNLQELFLNGQTSGKTTRTCVDKNNCALGFAETKDCSIKEAVSVRNKNWCNQNYTEVLNGAGVVIARLKKSINGESVNVDINANGEGYCAYCFDGIKNYDESGIDCGGSCTTCSNIKESIKTFYTSIYGLIISLVFFLGFLISSLLIANKLYQNFKQQGLVGKIQNKYAEWKKRGYDVEVIEDDVDIITQG